MSVPEQVPGSENTLRIPIDKLDGGLSTRTFPHLLPDNKLAIADNVVFVRDGLISKRPGNVLYGGGTGATGSGSKILSMGRFYFGTPRAGQLVVHSGTKLYKGNDGTGAFTSVGTGLSSTQPATFAQMRDPDMSSGNAIALFVCDGSRVPQVYDGTNFVAVQTGGNFLPNGVISGAPITPKFCVNWGQHMVYAGEPTDTGAAYISDILRPERFTAFGFTDSAGTQYIPYYPGGPDGTLGDITGLAVLGPFLLFFFTAGVISCLNTGSYGAAQFQFQRISSSTGCVSPRSIVAFDYFVPFFGGDRFYATDGISMFPLNDELPSVYSRNARSSRPPEITNPATVFGVRRSTQYWASYDSLGLGYQDREVVFDIAANGGYTFGPDSRQNGGAWARWPTGMPVGAAVECRGQGDTGQLYWGSSNADLVYQHDVGTYSDNGAPIQIEVRTKSFFFDKPVNSKMTQALYVMAVFDSVVAAYNATINGYVALDNFQPDVAPPVSIAVQQGGNVYNVPGSGAIFGTIKFNSPNANTQQITAKAYPSYPAKGNSLAMGMIEASTNPFNIIGFVVETTFDQPEFA